MEHLSAILSYTVNGIEYKVDLGTIISRDETFNKSTKATPIPSQSPDNTFAVDLGTSLTIDLKFIRKSPNEVKEGQAWTVTEDIGNFTGSPIGWTNKKWCLAWDKAMERWQMRSDGFKLTIIPDILNPYSGKHNELNGYVKSMSRRYTAEDNQSITGRLSFVVGRMHIEQNRLRPLENWDWSQLERSIDKDTISLYDSSGITYAPLLSANIEAGCTASVTISGGPECPFEVAKITVPKVKLSQKAQDILDSIKQGKNRLDMNLMGRHEMIVHDCSIPSNNQGSYRITAYGRDYKIQGMTISSSVMGTPKDCLERILDDALGQGTSGRIRYYYTDTDVDQVTFYMGDNAWYAIQVCAMLMGCRIFFADTSIYVIDYRLDPNTAISVTRSDYSICSYTSEVDLYSTSISNAAYAMAVGSASLGSEGDDTLQNRVTISCTGRNTSDTPYTYYTDCKTVCNSELSEEVYGTQENSVTLSIPQLNIEWDNDAKKEIYSPTASATVFGDNLLSYRDEPQQSITFTMRELVQNGPSRTWSPAFGPASRLSKIIDTVDSIILTNKSSVHGGKKWNKLTLSTYTHSYPEYTTEYTFGVMADISLSDFASQTTFGIK